MMWLLLYPRTLWLILRHPSRLHDKVKEELGQADELRFDDVISPPMCLLISVGIGTSLVGDDEADTIQWNALGKWIDSNAYNDWLLSAGIFALLPLIFAAFALRHSGGSIKRGTLRVPFYAHAWRVSPIALLLPLLIAQQTIAVQPAVSALIAILTVLLLGWYSRATVKALMDEGDYRLPKAIFMYVVGLLTAFLTMLLVIVAMIYEPPPLV